MPIPLKILLPVDVTHPNSDLVKNLNALVPLKDASIKLIYVREELPSYEHMLDAIGDFPDDWSHQIEQKARLSLEEIKSQLHQFCKDIQTEVISGPPALIIESVARSEGFDIVALNPGTHTKVERFLLGSTSSSVIKHGPGTSLILRPTDSTNKKLNDVIIAVDGSQQSLHALKVAAKQFQLANKAAKVSLIHVVSIVSIWKYISPVQFVAAIEDNLTMLGEALLAEAEKILADQGISNVQLVLKSGDPAEEIINLAQKNKSGLIIMGAQGRTAVQHFLLGAVSERVAMHAPCSTAVVKL